MQKHFSIIERHDNVKILTGVFSFYETYGVPFDLIIRYLYSNGYAIAWDYFIMDALKSGMNPRSLKSKITSSMQDSGVKFKPKHYEWVDNILEHNNENDT